MDVTGRLARARRASHFARPVSRLTPQAQDAIADPANLIVVSAASAWEISIKKALGKLAAPDDLEQQVRDGGFSPLPKASLTASRRGISRTIMKIPSTAC
jgi:PIN domain nuclease of toxin-antitoxin system